MNWYKIAQFNNVEFIEDNPIEKYLNIGHSEVFEADEDLENENVNYIWVFHDGRVLSVKEDWNNDVHEVAFPDLNLSRLFTGRYEKASGRLSIYRPWDGAAKHRTTPKAIQHKLYQEFPDVKQFYEF